MKNFKSPQLLAALLLISGFVFAATVLPNAIGANIEIIIDGPAANPWSYVDDTWDDHEVYSGIYIGAGRIGNNGEIIGLLSVTGGRYPIWGQRGQDWIVTDHEYVASAYAGGAKGSADAWVQVPQNDRAHDQQGAGFAPVNWNDPNMDSGMDAYDSTVLWAWWAGHRSMEAEAAHDAEDAIVTIGFSASGI